MLKKRIQSLSLFFFGYIIGTQTYFQEPEPLIMDSTEPENDLTPEDPTWIPEDQSDNTTAHRSDSENSPDQNYENSSDDDVEGNPNPRCVYSM